MANDYIQKPTTGQLFKNDRKTEERHPDYKGTFTDPHGNQYDIAAWVKDGKKGKFFSLKVSEKQEQPAREEDNDQEMNDHIRGAWDKDETPF